MIAIIKSETKVLGGDASKVFIGGFSEGGILALATYLIYAEFDAPLGGVISMSGMQGLTNYVKSVDKEVEKSSRNKKKTPWKVTEMRRKVPLLVVYGAEDSNVAGYEITYKAAFVDGVYQFAADQYKTETTEDMKDLKLSPKGKQALQTWLSARMP